MSVCHFYRFWYGQTHRSDVNQISVISCHAWLVGILEYLIQHGLVRCDKSNGLRRACMSFKKQYSPAPQRMNSHIMSADSSEEWISIQREHQFDSNQCNATYSIPDLHQPHITTNLTNRLPTLLVRAVAYQHTNAHHDIYKAALFWDSVLVWSSTMMKYAADCDPTDNEFTKFVLCYPANESKHHN